MFPTGIGIEAVEERHAAAVQRLAADPEIAATTNLPHPYPPGGALAWARHAIEGRARGTLFAFAIVQTATDVVGVCSLMGVSARHHAGELGYWIGTPYWGRGYATEAGRQVLRVGFEDLRLQRVEAGVLDKNPASARVLQKLGFLPTGIRTWHEKGRGRTFVLERETWLSMPRHERDGEAPRAP